MLLACGVYVGAYLAFGGRDAYQSVGEEVNLSDVVEREGTIYERLGYYWPKAVGDIIANPAFGVGFGRYNDSRGRNGWMEETSDRHAHSSSLHYIAELGVIGAFPIFMFWYSLVRNTSGKEGEECIQLAVICLVVTSLFEHTLSSLVSVCLIFFTFPPVLGARWGASRGALIAGRGRWRRKSVRLGTSGGQRGSGRVEGVV
jgi:hypothetical protein